jgi:hypothetical protein
MHSVPDIVCRRLRREQTAQQIDMRRPPSSSADTPITLLIEEEVGGGQPKGDSRRGTGEGSHFTPP